LIPGHIQIFGHLVAQVLWCLKAYGARGQTSANIQNFKLMGMGQIFFVIDLAAHCNATGTISG
jgi:hypothetical protein